MRPKLNFTVGGFRNGRKDVIERSKRVLMKSMFKMQELAIERAPTDQGELRNKIRVNPQLLAERYELTSGAKHSAALELGSRPFWAPIQPLKDWSRRTLGDEGAAYAVQKSIAKNGIRAQPFMRPAYDEVNLLWIDYYKNQEFKD